MSGSSNRVTDASSRKHALVSSMHIDGMRFGCIKEQLLEDVFFAPILAALARGDESLYSLHDGFLFLGDCLSIPDGSLRFLLMQQVHNFGHFRHDKTLALLKYNFFWSSMN